MDLSEAKRIMKIYNQQEFGLIKRSEISSKQVELAVVRIMREIQVRKLEIIKLKLSKK